MRISRIEGTGSFDRDDSRRTGDYGRGSRERTDRRNAKQRKRRTVMFGAVLAPMLLSVILVFTLSISTAATPEHDVYKYYTSVEVASGDTLWSIADRYMGEGSFDKRDYIEEVCLLNHIYGDDITAGEYLVVPYYSAEVR